jgi:hypothetical protein
MVLESILSILGFGAAKAQINLPPVARHDIEAAPERRARTLKHLIKANHATKAIVGKDGVPNNLSVVSST